MMNDFSNFKIGDGPNPNINYNLYSTGKDKNEKNQKQNPEMYNYYFGSNSNTYQGSIQSNQGKGLERKFDENPLNLNINSQIYLPKNIRKGHGQGQGSQFYGNQNLSQNPDQTQFQSQFQFQGQKFTNQDQQKSNINNSVNPLFFDKNSMKNNSTDQKNDGKEFDFQNRQSKNTEQGGKFN